MFHARLDCHFLLANLLIESDQMLAVSTTRTIVWQNAEVWIPLVR